MKRNHRKLSPEQWETRCTLLTHCQRQMAEARDLSRLAGAVRASRAIARALKSLDGAMRHASAMKGDNRHAD